MSVTEACLRRRLAIAIVTLALAFPGAAMAQRRAMPDLSGAPADIQAIWKKVQSGGRPTMEEAQKLGQYLAAYAGDIESSARRSADSVRTAAPQQAARALGRTTDPAKACPARSPALATVARSAPTAAAAAAFLDTITRTVFARETPAAAHRLQAGLAKATSVAALEAMGQTFYAGGFDGAAVATFAEAARWGGAAAQRNWTNLGAILVSYGDPAHSITALRRAMALGPSYPLLVHQLGIAYADLGDLAAAESLLTNVTKSAPTFGLAWDALARVQSCTGNMSAAWHSLAQAQEANWSTARERILDKHEPESNDDAVEAQKPFPEPSGASPFSSGARMAPANFDASTPAIADTWKEERGRPIAFMQTANAYQALASKILQQESAADAAAAGVQQSGGAAAAINGMLLTIDVSNGRQALAAIEKLRYRNSARQAMVLAAYRDKDVVIAKEAGRLREAIEQEHQACINKKLAANQEPALCTPPYCRAYLAAAGTQYEQERDNARVYIGGVAGLAGTYDKTMRDWFYWAGDPGTRRTIDAERRYQLAIMTMMQYKIAELVPDYSTDGSGCLGDQYTKAVEAAEAKGIDPADPGTCPGLDLSVQSVATVSGDCKHVRMTIDLEELPVTPTLDYKRATHDHAGSLFMGAGKEMLHGAVGAEAGLQVNFDEGGWVQGFGPAGSVTVGSDKLVTISANGMLNILDHGSLGQAGISMAGPGFEVSLATDTGFTGHLDI